MPFDNVSPITEAEPFITEVLELPPVMAVPVMVSDCIHEYYSQSSGFIFYSRRHQDVAKIKEQARRILIKTLERLTPRDRWTKGVMQSNSGAMCLIGAITCDYRIASNMVEPIGQAVQLAVDTVRLHCQKRGYGSIEDFNDREYTTHKDVLCVLYDAIASL